MPASVNGFPARPAACRCSRRWARAGSRSSCVPSSRASRPMPPSLLLIGESGSGREALARFVHEIGPRARSRSSRWWRARSREDNVEARCSVWTGRTASPGCSTRPRAVRCSSRDLEDLAPRAQRLLLGVHRNRQLSRVGGNTSQPFNARSSPGEPGIEARAGAARACAATCWAH